MKVLILSCNTGEGHNSAAYALHETLLGFGEESEVMDTLKNSTTTTRGYRLLFSRRRSTSI